MKIEKSDWQWLIALITQIALAVWAVHEAKEKPSNRTGKDENHR